MAPRHIYIIKCEQGKYYVGKSTNLTTRIEEHQNGNGAEWTKKYPMIKVKKIICDQGGYAEDKYTLKMMKKYGIQNVRGGSFCQINLNSDEIVIINRMIQSATDSCFKCGKSGHLSYNCPDAQVKTCYNCGSTEHLASSCTEAGGSTDQSNKKCYKCNSTDHLSYNCPDSQVKTCYNCGLVGHLANSCPSNN